MLKFPLFIVAFSSIFWCYVYPMQPSLEVFVWVFSHKGSSFSLQQTCVQISQQYFTIKFIVYFKRTNRLLSSKWFKAAVQIFSLLGFLSRRIWEAASEAVHDTDRRAWLFQLFLLWKFCDESACSHKAEIKFDQIQSPFSCVWSYGFLP